MFRGASSAGDEREHKRRRVVAPVDPIVDIILQHQGQCLEQNQQEQLRLFLHQKLTEVRGNQPAKYVWMWGYGYINWYFFNVK
jgi:hypothetical protein